MIKEGDIILVTGFNCGKRATSKFLAMGIRRNTKMSIRTIQPDGPYVVDVGKSEYTIGRGLFNKLIYEVL